MPDDTLSGYSSDFSFAPRDEMEEPSAVALPRRSGHDRAPAACNLCRLWRVRCSGGQPCSLCARRSAACIFTPVAKGGRPRRAVSAAPPSPTVPLPPPAPASAAPAPLPPPALSPSLALTPAPPPPAAPPSLKRARRASLSPAVVAAEELVAVEVLSSLSGRSNRGESRAGGGASIGYGSSIFGALGAARDSVASAASGVMASAATGAMGAVLSAGASILEYLPNLDERGLAPRWHGNSEARAAVLTSLSAAERELLASFIDTYNMIVVVVEAEALFAGLENLQAVGLLPWQGARAAAARAAVISAHTAAAVSKGGGGHGISGSSGDGGSRGGGGGVASSSSSSSSSGSGSTSGSSSGSSSSTAAPAGGGGGSGGMFPFAERTSEMRREGAECQCTAACYFAILAMAAQRRGWDVAARACVDASFEASLGVLLHSSQHMVSALILLATLAFCAGDSVQANRLSAAALTISEPDGMSPVVLGLAHRFAAIFSRAPLSPTPPLLAPPGSSLSVAARAIGELHGWVYRVVMSNSVVNIDEATWTDFIMRITAGWRSINDVCGTGFRGAPIVLLRDFTSLAVALRVGDAARALPPARRIANFLAISMKVGASLDDICLLVILGRALPVMRAAGEARVVSVFGAALRSSAFSRAIFQGAADEDAVADIPVEAAAATWAATATG